MSGHHRNALSLRCSRILVSLLAGCAVAASAALVPPSAASSAPVGDNSWLHTDGAKIVTETGGEATIRAVNWFGMETASCAPHGLWQISLDQAMDQIVSFGFNAIRLPYSSECLSAGAAAVSGVDSRVNPDLQGLTPQQLMDKVVDAAAARNVRVILDRHRPDSGAQSELWYTSRYPEQRWIDDWVALAARYRDQPAVIGADLHNEPHGAACWGCGDPAVDWAAAATRAGNAILAVNQHWLILIEGVERQATGGTTWWGGGLADAAAHPITLAVPHQLVYSPHDYPASVFAQRWFADPSYPDNLPSLWDRNWGYLAEQGIAPVLLGEFGTKLATPSDAAWLDTLVTYLDTQRMSFAYWSFNPNSGDTGGLVADDWRTPQQAKLNALAPLLNRALGSPLAAASAADTVPPEAPNPSPPTTATPPATTSTSATTGPSTHTGEPPPNPPSAPATPATHSTATAGGGGIVVTWQLESSWPTGYVAQLVVHAPGNEVDDWSVSWPDTHARAVVNAWGLSCAVNSGEIRCQGADWAAHIPSGGTVTVGLQVSNDGTTPTAPPLTIQN